MKYGTAIPVGRGASSEILKAWDPDLERHVAIKLLNRDDPQSVQRMLLEARAQARVEHPNVCDVYEVGDIDGRPYIAMRFIDGRPLDEAAVDLPLTEKVRLVHTVTEAVHEAHRAGLVHRDLKPANILVEPDEDGTLVPYVLDFGIAREYAASGFTTPGQVLGTPGYMSPEQVRGETATLDRRADIFSIGALLYELAAGRHPFEGSSSVEVLVGILHEEPPALEELAPDLPSDLCTIIHKCLEKERQHRYDSARDLAEDLQRWLNGEPVLARAREEDRRVAHPSGFGAYLLATLGLVLICLTALFAHGWQKERAKTRSQALTLEIERVEAGLRQAHMSPPHDLSSHLLGVEKALETLVQEKAQGPALLALGRTYLLLDQPHRALEILQESWDSGLQTPEAALILASSLIELDVRQRQAPGCRESLAEAPPEAPRDFLPNALEVLPLARDAPGRYSSQSTPTLLTTPYPEGLLALAEGDYAEAVRCARATLDILPWLIEARLLEGRAHLLRAQNLQERRAFEGADAVLNAAESAFDAAAEIAPGDRRAQQGLCAVRAQRSMLASLAVGGP